MQLGMYTNDKHQSHHEDLLKTAYCETLNTTISPSTPHHETYSSLWTCHNRMKMSTIQENHWNGKSLMGPAMPQDRLIPVLASVPQSPITSSPLRQVITPLTSHRRRTLTSSTSSSCTSNWHCHFQLWYNVSIVDEHCLFIPLVVPPVPPASGSALLTQPL